MYKDFGRWLKQNRKKLGWTQQELAAKTTFSHTYISLLERGETHNVSGGVVQPSKKFISEVSAAFADTPAQRDLLEREGRILAGWPETDEIPSYEAIKKLISENPTKAVLLTPRGGGTIAVVDTAELAREITRLLKQDKSLESDT